MKIEKNKLVKVVWKSKEFKDVLHIENVDGLVFDTMRVLDGWILIKKIGIYVHFL